MYAGAESSIPESADDLSARTTLIIAPLSVLSNWLVGINHLNCWQQRCCFQCYLSIPGVSMCHAFPLYLCALPCQTALEDWDFEDWRGFVKLSERLRSLASAWHSNVTAVVLLSQQSSALNAAWDRSALCNIAPAERWKDTASCCMRGEKHELFLPLTIFNSMFTVNLKRIKAQWPHVIDAGLQFPIQVFVFLNFQEICISYLDCCQRGRSRHSRNKILR